MKTLLKKITQIILRENPNNLLDLCIVGLGNPGDKHKKTRHNAGYDFVELLANDLNVELKDTKKLDINISEKSIVILPRIDTELSDSQIYQLFKTLNKKGVKHILFIPAQLISIKSILIQLYILFKALIQKKSLVDCGYSRSRAKFKKLWKEYYDIHKSYNFKYLFLINKNL